MSMKSPRIVLCFKHLLSTQAIHHIFVLLLVLKKEVERATEKGKYIQALLNEVCASV